MTKFTQLLLAGAGILGGVTTASAQNLLLNAKFTQGLPLNQVAPNPDQATNAAADKWTTWVNTGTQNGLVKTQRVTSDLIPGGAMLHVIVEGGAGLVQQFISDPLQPGQSTLPPPSLAYACVWIKLVQGGVAVGLGHGGNTHSQVALLQPTFAATRLWQRLEVSTGQVQATTNPPTPQSATELTIYAYGGPKAEYFVGSASVEATTKPIGCQP